MPEKQYQDKLQRFLGIKMTQEELEKHLWEAGNILRGSVDASEYKHFIFGLLFLKRLNDVFEEKLETTSTRNSSKMKDTNEQDIFIPSEARWNSLSSVSISLNSCVVQFEGPELATKSYTTPSILASKESLARRSAAMFVLAKKVVATRTPNVKARKSL